MSDRDRNRHVLTLDLRDDPEVIAAYRQYHAAIWPEVVSSLRAAGVRQMDIFALGRRLVMILELGDGLDLRRVFEEHSVSSPKVAEWERLMKTLQQPAPDAPAGQWWAQMESVCRLPAGSGGAAPLRTL